MKNNGNWLRIIIGVTVGTLGLIFLYQPAYAVIVKAITFIIMALTALVAFGLVSQGVYKLIVDNLAQWQKNLGEAVTRERNKLLHPAEWSEDEPSVS